MFSESGSCRFTLLASRVYDDIGIQCNVQDLILSFSLHHLVSVKCRYLVITLCCFVSTQFLYLSLQHQVATSLLSIFCKHTNTDYLFYTHIYTLQIFVNKIIFFKVNTILNYSVHVCSSSYNFMLYMGMINIIFILLIMTLFPSFFLYASIECDTKLACIE